MKYFKLKQIALALIMMVLVVSCIEDVEPTPRSYTAYGFLTKTGDTYYVELDGGTKVKLMPFDDSGYDFEEMTRVLFQFTIEEEYETSAPINYLVNVQGNILIVDYSPIVELNDESRDTIGKGFMELEFLPVSINEYLNLSVLYEKKDGYHVFSLCYDPEAQEEGKPIILDLKNKQPEEDKDGKIVRSYKSFNLSGLLDLGQLDGDGEMKFTLRINRGDSQEANFDLIYKPILE